ncbi:MAG: flagellar basal body-associated FliL family protein [Spirochaetaceae bacterium]|jgi:flagellar FliL protein|nr:flagellar basal body-associated FliL family protein [Spirochaetaceae bacterium]
MSDEPDIELEEEAGADGGGAKKPGVGLLPKLLKFIAIGLGALVFIVTVAVITFNIMTKGGKSQTVVPQTDAYIAVKKQYSMFTLIGTVNTRTKDPTPWMVSVDMIIGYDLNDNAAATELTSRLYELRDFVRRYFSGKTSSELQPENEGRIKIEIRELLNTTILDRARARTILFNRLDLYEME